MAKPDKIFAEKLKALEQIVTDSTAQVSELEAQMLRDILREFVPDFDFVDGSITQSERNYLQVNKIDKIVEEYQARYAEIVNRMSELMIVAKDKTLEYFDSLGLDRQITAELGDQANAMLKSIGIGERGEIISGSYLSKVSEMADVQQKIKEYTISQVNSGATLKEFGKGFENLLQTTPKVNGLMVRYTTQFTHDTLFNLQRAIDRNIGKAHGMEYWFYEGTEIKTSRPFCAGGEDKIAEKKFDSKLNKVFTTEEVQKWTGEDWQGKNEGAYDPFVNVGGYNCRHILRPVTIEFARRRRSDLK